MDVKKYCYLCLATIFGASFMWLAFMAVELGLSMLPIKWALTNEPAEKYIDTGIIIFGAIIGYLNGSKWWTTLYHGNGSLKEKYQGLQGVKLRLRGLLHFLREIG